jgi:hypothetical protein
MFRIEVNAEEGVAEVVSYLSGQGITEAEYNGHVIGFPFERDEEGREVNADAIDELLASQQFIGLLKRIKNSFYVIFDSQGKLGKVGDVEAVREIEGLIAGTERLPSNVRGVDPADALGSLTVEELGLEEGSDDTHIAELAAMWVETAFDEMGWVLDFQATRHYLALLKSRVWDGD